MKTIRITNFNTETATTDEIYKVLLVGKIYDLLSNDDNYLTLGVKLNDMTISQLEEAFRKLF
jgi:hypothetical protein